MADIWTHRDIVEDVFTLSDLLDAWDLIRVKEENERRTQVFQELKMWQPGGGR